MISTTQPFYYKLANANLDACFQLCDRRVAIVVGVDVGFDIRIDIDIIDIDRRIDVDVLFCHCFIHTDLI